MNAHDENAPVPDLAEEMARDADETAAIEIAFFFSGTELVG